MEGDQHAPASPASPLPTAYSPSQRCFEKNYTGLITHENFQAALLARMSTYLLKRFSMIAFSVHRSSAGKELACQRRRSSALERYSVLAISVRN